MSAELWVPECGSMNSDNRSNKIIFYPCFKIYIVVADYYYQIRVLKCPSQSLQFNFFQLIGQHTIYCTAMSSMNTILFNTQKHLHTRTPSNKQQIIL